jgi:DNA-binding transcriptional LysR family regulator
MDVRTLKTFLAIVDHSGFAAAGEVIGLSTSGVSLQIKALEEEFDISLFDRSTRPPQLTADGLQFAARAREAVLSWERLTENMADDSLNGVLKLGAIPTVVSGILPKALKKLQQTRPQLRIKLTTGLSHVLDEMLRKGTLDAALTVQPELIGPSMQWTGYSREALAVIAPAGIEFDDDKTLLMNNPYICFERYAWVGRMITAELSRRNIVVTTTMEVDTLDGVFGLVANGLGVSIVPWRRIEKPFPENVNHVRFGAPALSRELGVMQRKNNPRGHLVEELLFALTDI